MLNKKMIALSLVLVLTLGIVVTMTNATEAFWPFGGDEEEAEKLSGEVVVDGSSTVYPITEAVAEEFRKVQPDVRVSVAYSGTGGGFKKFVVEETDINDASRQAKPEEKKKAKQNGIEMVRFTVAYDGISVVTNPKNTWAKNMTVEQLNKLWEPGSNVQTWSDLNPNWPDKEIKLYGPGSDSGTFDYFTEAINGEEGATRADYTPSENDNTLVQGVAGNKYALGYFGYAYYLENKEQMNVVSVNNGDGAVKPSMKTIGNGEYQPLARPLFMYVNKKSLQRPEVKKFLKYYMNNAKKLVPQVGYVPLAKEKYQSNIDKIEKLTQ